MAPLFKSLVVLSEKAANLARIIRSERALFELLVEEKTGVEKNKKFVQDFKTLGDVLIQEMIRHEIADKFPNLGDYVFGEESNKFTNTLGESITVCVQGSREETCSLLTKVLDGNGDAASLLADAVHQEQVEVTSAADLKELDVEVDTDSLGIWIDPIDGTAQYIKGLDESAIDGIHEEGLQCSVILIGAFDRNSGEPVMGVISQPFYQSDADQRWRGRHIWGVSYGGLQANSLTPSAGGDSGPPGLTVLMSRSENDRIKATLGRLAGAKIRYASGAGYKILCAIECVADAYILSVGSTFKWDTCGPHAILRSAGGGVLDLRRALELYRAAGASPSALDLSPAELRYDKPDEGVGGDEPGQRWANAGGMVAYRRREVLLEILEALS